MVLRIYCEINIITDMLKKHESEDMIKTEARKTWSDHANFTLRNRFSWISLDPTRAGLHGKPLAVWAIPHIIPHLDIRGKWKWCTPPPPPRSQHPAHATAPMQHKPGIHVQWGGE